MPTNSLVDALFDKLRVLHPTRDHHDLLTSARIVAACRAYAHDGQRLVPTGTAAQMARARQEAPALVDLLAKEHIGAVTSKNPLDRVEARLNAMGTSIDEQFGSGGALVAPRGAERARAALSSKDPIVRTQARLYLLGATHDDIPPFEPGDAA